MNKPPCYRRGRRVMAICDLNELNGLLAGGRAPDGARSRQPRPSGIAVSDVSRTIATARTTLRRTKFSRDIETLRAIDRRRRGSAPSSWGCRSTWTAARARARSPPAIRPRGWPRRCRCRSPCGTSAGPPSRPNERDDRRRPFAQASARAWSTKWRRPTSCKARSTACARRSGTNPG